jgi:hypothetical protein
MKRISLVAGCALLALAGNAPMSGGKHVPVATPNGKPLSCVSISSLGDSEVRDDWTIDFHSGGKQWYRVTLPQRCNGLGTYRSFKYETSLSELCNTDIITVMEYGGPGGGPRGSCGMGMFQPVLMGK